VTDKAVIPHSFSIHVSRHSLQAIISNTLHMYLLPLHGGGASERS